MGAMYARSSGSQTDAIAKPQVLVLSRTEELKNQICRAVGDGAGVVHATNLRKAIEATERIDVSVVITDATTKRDEFISLRNRLSQYADSAVWILAAERGQTNDLLNMVNSGEIFRFLFKPIATEQARQHIDAALQQNNRGRLKVVPKLDETLDSLPVLSEDEPQIEEIDFGSHSEIVLETKEPESFEAVLEAAPQPQNTEPEAHDAESFDDDSHDDRMDVDPFGSGDGRDGTSMISLAVIASMVAGLVLAAGAAWMFIVYMNKQDAVLVQRADVAEIEAFEALAQAATAFDDGRYVEPEFDNALFYNQLVLEREPTNEEANLGLDRIAQVYVQQLITALQDDRPEDAISARITVEQIRPDHPQLNALDRELSLHAVTLLTEVRDALEAGEIEQGQERLDLATLILSPDDPQVMELSELIATTLRTSRVDELASEARQKIREGRLVAPANDNAKAYLEQLHEFDAESEAFDSGMRSLSNALLARARTYRTRGEFNTARRWINEAGTLDVDTAGVLRARQAVDNAEREAQIQAAAATAQATAAAETAASEALAAEPPAVQTVAATPARSDPIAATESEAKDRGGFFGLFGSRSDDSAGSTVPPEIVSLESLTTVNYVAPRYPREATRFGVTGWVDVEFTVNERGETQDIDILDAEPRGYQFERATLSAVKKWTFQPKRVDGRPVAQRTRLRVDFAQ